MIAAVHTTDAGAGRRRRLLVGDGGVVILGEERRATCGGGHAWVIVSAHLVTPDEVPRCALDIREAWARAALRAPYIAPLRDVGSYDPTRRLPRPEARP